MKGATSVLLGVKGLTYFFVVDWGVSVVFLGLASCLLFRGVTAPTGWTWEPRRSPCLRNRWDLGSDAIKKKHFFFAKKKTRSEKNCFFHITRFRRIFSPEFNLLVTAALFKVTFVTLNFLAHLLNKYKALNRKNNTMQITAMGTYLYLVLSLLIILR